MEPPRKRIRRLVNSCLECRRRKIRCNLNANGSDKCTACAARDIHCERWRESDEVPDENSLELSARLRRVESLLQNMTDIESNAPQSFMSAASANGSVTAPIEADSHPPLMSLFDNEIFGHTGPSSPAEAAEDHRRFRPSPGPQDTRLEKLRLVLGALLPSQEDADTIAVATNAWGIARILYPGDEGSRNPDFHMATIAKSSPLVISRTLMKYAIFLQQMPPEFDSGTIHFESSVQAVLQKYLHYVTDLVTSKDDYACTLQGLECLLLQSLFYINDGNLRRAWLAARRCLMVAQFLGLQRSYLAFARNSIADATQKARAFMWVRTVMVDRYLAPILGLPSGVAEDCFGDHGLMPQIQDPLDILERRLCVIAGLIASRNQKDPAPGYTTTLEIDESMDLLAKDLGDTLENIPSLPEGQHSSEEDPEYKLVLNQVWFYQLRLFLHIPWMLRAFTDSKFEYSRIACLHASREKLKRYLALRSTNNTQGTARVMDFATVIAATTLILNQVGLPALLNDAKYKENDMRLVQDVKESMRVVSRGPREFMARQGVEVIEALLALKNGGQAKTTNRSVRLTMPFFGPISICKAVMPSSPVCVAATPTSTRETDLYGNLGLPDEAPEIALNGGTTENIYPDYGHQLSFEHTDMSVPGWLPPLEAWDFDNVLDWDATFGLWDVPNWDS